MGETYKLYLRDTSVLQHKHVAALSKESDEVTRLLGNTVIYYQTLSRWMMKWVTTFGAFSATEGGRGPIVPLGLTCPHL
jgi:hypothetical protein